jgi:hypothetical protein
VKINDVQQFHDDQIELGGGDQAILDIGWRGKMRCGATSHSIPFLSVDSSVLRFETA